MAPVIGIFPQLTRNQTSTITVTEDVKAEGGIVSFTVYDQDNTKLLSGNVPEGTDGFNLHVTEASGVDIFNLKRGMLDQGFVGENPYKRGHLFKIHKQHLTTSPDLEVTVEGQQGKDKLLYHFDRSEVTYKDTPVAKTTQRSGVKRNYEALDKFTVEVAQGVDIAVIVALCICADQHICDRRYEGYTEP